MVPIAHRVTDISQVKLHAQDDGLCVSLKEGEWVWMAKEVAHTLSAMLEIGTGTFQYNDEEIKEDQYEVSYQLPGSSETHKLTVIAISAVDAMTQFYENAPEEYKAQLSSIEVVKK